MSSERFLPGFIFLYFIFSPFLFAFLQFNTKANEFIGLKLNISLHLNVYQDNSSPHVTSRCSSLTEHEFNEERVQQKNKPFIRRNEDSEPILEQMEKIIIIF